ncbi:MAG: transglutaminase domain-containing protein [Atopobiaceae bacterium]|nr:transglutaminase domain-containing protein [Atopobiaceae bacterium]
MRMQTYGSRVYAVSGSPTNIPGPAGQFEAVRISLTGELAKDYDVWYRVHAPEIGWLAWAKNGELAGSSGLVWQFADLQMIVLPKGTSVSQDVTDVQSVTKSAYMVLPGTSSRGRMEASGWQDWDLEGEVSGVIGETRCLEALKLKLVGDISSTYNVWYRSQVEGYGWLGWARNGQSSGVLGRTNRLEAIEIRIMSKEAAALGSTAHAYWALISGDAELDSILDAIIYAETSERPRTLREAFDYVTTLPYVDGATEYYGDWRKWSIPLAKQMYNRPGGNCYGYGALMAWVARALGYDARAVSSEIRSGVLAWSYHGWCEIMQNGKPYVLDPDLQKYVPDRNFFMVSYEDAPTYYTEYVSASK